MCPKLEVTVRAAAESIQNLSKDGKFLLLCGEFNNVSIIVSSVTISETIALTRKVGFQQYCVLGLEIIYSANNSVLPF